MSAQQRLSELHYDITSPDGKFGKEMVYALMAFQKVNGLNVDGRLTPTVVKAFDSPTIPSARVPNGGVDRIEVDLSKQFLVMYRNNEVFKIVEISSGTALPFCALDPDTGKDACDVAVTPTGSFKVQSRITGYRESKLGLLYNPLYFNGGFAIHGSQSVPATPASHGCIRIPISTSNWMVNQITDGTPVYVFNDNTNPTPVSGAKTATTTTTSTTTTTVAGATTTSKGSTSTTALGSSTSTTKSGTSTTNGTSAISTTAGTSTTTSSSTTSTTLSGPTTSTSPLAHILTTVGTSTSTPIATVQAATTTTSSSVLPSSTIVIQTPTVTTTTVAPTSTIPIK